MEEKQKYAQQRQFFVRYKCIEFVHNIFTNLVKEGLVACRQL